MFRRALMLLISILPFKHELKFICLYVYITSLLNSEYTRLLSERAVVWSVRTIAVIIIRIIYLFEYVNNVPSHDLNWLVLSAFGQPQLAVRQDVLGNRPRSQTKAREQIDPRFVGPKLVFGNVAKLDCVSGTHDIEDVFESYHLDRLVSLHVFVKADAH